MSKVDAAAMSVVRCFGMCLPIAIELCFSSTHIYMAGLETTLLQRLDLLVILVTLRFVSFAKDRVSKEALELSHLHLCD